MPRPRKAMKVGVTMAGHSLVLQAAAELPPATLPSPTPSFEAEGLQLILEGLVVHGPVVLRLTESLGRMERVNQYERIGNLGMLGRVALPSPS